MKVSFICASYNYANYIAQTIESVIAQDIADWELIVFDDGSKDNSIEVINSYVKKDSRVKLFVHENNQNKGLINTIKAACNVAEGDWLAFIESDDILKPNYLSKKLDVIKANPDAQLVFSGVEILSSKVIQDNYIKIFERRNNLIKKDFNIAMLIQENPIPTFSCVMIKKSLFNSLDFSSPLAQNIDWWLWAQVLSSHKVVYVDENLSVWRRHENSYITSIDHAKMNNFIRSLFEFIFKSNIPILPRLMLELHLFLSIERIDKLFRTPARYICKSLRNSLYLMNKIKPVIIYYKD